MRNSERKHTQNKAVKSRLKTLEKNFLASIKTGKKDEADRAFRAVASGFDKAAKTGVVHSATASRKKSRLGTRLAALK